MEYLLEHTRYSETQINEFYRQVKFQIIMVFYITSMFKYHLCGM